MKDFFEGRDDVLVGSEGYLYREARTRSDLFVPDIVFAHGVNTDVIVQAAGNRGVRTREGLETRQSPGRMRARIGVRRG